MSSKSKLLADLASEVDQGFIEDTFEVNGHSYKMRLLSDGETNWKNRYVDALSSALSMLSQRKSATLAVAIRSIDGQSVESLYAPVVDVDLNEEDKKAAEKKVTDWTLLGKLERQFRVAADVYDFLSARPEAFVTSLWEKFQELENRRDEVIKNLKK